MDEITPLILTHNEAPNIRRTLDKLQWAKTIVIVDSGSTDGTLKILDAHTRVQVWHHEFIDFESQWNYGISCVTTPWILSLDADYELSEELVGELQTLTPSTNTIGYRAEFIYRIFGRSLRGTLYPSRVVLFRRGVTHYRQEGHTQQLKICGEVLSLQGKIFHDDRKPLARWLTSQQRYAREEAEYLLARRDRALTRVDKIRLVAWPAPLAVLFYVLFIKQCLFDGWPGWYYVLQRLIAETLLAIELTDRRLRGGLTADPETAGDEH